MRPNTTSDESKTLDNGLISMLVSILIALLITAGVRIDTDAALYSASPHLFRGDNSMPANGLLLSLQFVLSSAIMNHQITTEATILQASHCWYDGRNHTLRRLLRSYSLLIVTLIDTDSMVPPLQLFRMLSS